jgi:hypothetical protein
MDKTGMRYIRSALSDEYFSRFNIRYFPITSIVFRRIRYGRDMSWSCHAEKCVLFHMHEFFARFS